MGGEFSLQNGLEVAGRSLGHQPRHGSREAVIVTSALSTCDPGYLLTETLPKLQQASIRVSCIALTAELHVCRKITEATAGVMGVCLDQQYLRDWMMAQCTPPPSSKKADEMGCEMIRMGFPSRKSHETAELVHAGRQKTLLARTAFTWYVIAPKRPIHEHSPYSSLDPNASRLTRRIPFLQLFLQSPMSGQER